MSKRTQEEQEQAERIYASSSEELNKRYISNSEHYDKAILTLSSASLGFSVFVLNYIVPWKSACFLWLLFVAWGALGLSVVCSLLGYRIANRAIKALNVNIQAYYLHNTVEEPETPYTKRLNDIVAQLNWLMGVLFVVGLFAALLFVSLNIT